MIETVKKAAEAIEKSQIGNGERTFRIGVSLALSDFNNEFRIFNESLATLVRYKTGMKGE